MQESPHSHQQTPEQRVRGSSLRRPTRPYALSNRVRWRCGLLPIFAATLIGCAAANTTRVPTVELTVRAAPPVGGTIPMLIKRECTANCGWTSIPLTRQQVSALDRSGHWIEALPLYKAVDLAGGSQPLLEGINAAESPAITITRESTFETQRTSQGIFAFLALPAAISAARSLGSQPPEDIRRLRLREVAIPECPGSDLSHGCTMPREIYQLRHDPKLGGDHGWVFFPSGVYERVRVSYDWAPSAFPPEERRSVAITTPWR